MSASNQTPAKNGALSSESKPQVVVRAGKTYVCSSCGTLVEIPADVVGQLVLAVEPDSPEKPGKDPPAPAATASDRAVSSPPLNRMMPRPKRPKQPKRDVFVGELIDGLRVPSADQLDRALKWVSFHLRVLDRQGSEIKRLTKLLDDRKVPCLPPRGHAQDATKQPRPEPSRQPEASHAHEDVSMSPDVSNKNQRGPP